MKIAVLGPVAKDFITINNKQSIQIGGIPYYVSLALKNLGVESVTSYVTAGKEDKNWLIENFRGLEIKHIEVEKTLESISEYLENNPDIRKNTILCYPNTIKATDTLIKELNDFDYIIFGPLFHDNIPFDLFYKLRHKNLVYGNFGLFTYGENGKFVRKNPENLIKVLPFLRYVFLDKDEARFISKKQIIKESGRFFQDNGLPNMIITEGSHGSHLFVGHDYYKIPAFTPTQIVDPTGAGDTYLAAFIKASELFTDPVKRGKFAAMVATMSLEKKGAFSSTLEEVMKRLIESNVGF